MTHDTRLICENLWNSTLKNANSHHIYFQSSQPNCVVRLFRNVNICTLPRCLNSNSLNCSNRSNEGNCYAESRASSNLFRCLGKKMFFRCKQSTLIFLEFSNSFLRRFLFLFYCVYVKYIYIFVCVFGRLCVNVMRATGKQRCYSFQYFFSVNNVCMCLFR